MEVIAEKKKALKEQKEVKSGEVTSSMADEKYALIDEARKVLRGEFRNSAELEKLYHKLEDLDQFAYAAEVLLFKMDFDRKEGQPVSRKELHALVRHIYNDTSLSSDFKFVRGLNQLEQHADLSETEDAETLGLAGAIYKRRWMYDQQSANLDRAYFFYERGFQSWQKYTSSAGTAPAEWNDYGYTGINCAYILQLKAANFLEQMRDVPGAIAQAAGHLSQCREIRRAILNHYVGSEQELRSFSAKESAWIAAIVAEACFGLLQYEKSAQFIHKHLQLVKAGDGSFMSDQQVRWKVRTLAQQLSSIASMQLSMRSLVDNGGKSTDILKDLFTEVDERKISAVLGVIVGEGSKSSPVIKNQRVGVSLSGGGFRASLYHIGVLSALAEQDMLKDVEVLSCVSGGSIIGAFYYLKLKQLLESKSDADISREDYIRLIGEVEREFLHGVQKNIRMRVLSNLWCNLKMMTRNYSRTHRLGELYEEQFFARLVKKKGEPAFMRDLFIQPKDMADFSISIDNWQRRNKVPQLIINSTSINTGHNFQFTASWMGEPPMHLLADVDVKPRLRRMYYKDAPEPYKNFRLGYAVAASSCVPVLFEPLPMYGLYESEGKEIDLQLIDGGLHDNQGIAALLEQECNDVIISDGSGQLPLNVAASTNELSVFYRADSMLQERLRELQFRDLHQRKSTTQIAGLVAVHLKSGLQSPSISWKFCDDPPRKLYDEKIRDDRSLTDAGIIRAMQKQLSEVRTDLDCFHDTEAYALMYAGYAQTKSELNKCGRLAFLGESSEWRFLSMREKLMRSEKADALSKLLSVSGRLTAKVFFISKTALILAIAIGFFLAAALAFAGEYLWSAKMQISGSQVAYSVLLVGIAMISKWLAAAMDARNFFRKKLFFGLLALSGFIGCNLYLWLFNRLYKNAGKISK